MWLLDSGAKRKEGNGCTAAGGRKGGGRKRQKSNTGRGGHTNQKTLNMIIPRLPVKIRDPSYPSCSPIHVRCSCCRPAYSHLSSLTVTPSFLFVSSSNPPRVSVYREHRLVRRTRPTIISELTLAPVDSLLLIEDLLKHGCHPSN